MILVIIKSGMEQPGVLVEIIREWLIRLLRHPKVYTGRAGSSNLPPAIFLIFSIFSDI